MRQIVLASTSPYRRAQLEQLGLAFEVWGSGVDEEPYKQSATSPEALARELSVAKVEAVAGRFPEAVIIGGDQVAELDGEVLDKPGSFEGSVAQLQRLVGRSHKLWSGLAVLDASTGQAQVQVALTTLTMRPLSVPQIEAYVGRDEPWDCCGSYKVESVGIALFSAIEGDDHTAIQGIPLLALVSLLEGLGISVWGGIT